MKWSELTNGERDQLVHEKVMGHRPNEPCTGRFIPKNPEPDGLYCTGCDAEIGWGDKEYHEQPHIPEYTTDISAAWSVVQKFNEIELISYVKGKWHCSLWRGASKFHVRAKSVQGAICIAALQSHGVEL